MVDNKSFKKIFKDLVEIQISEKKDGDFCPADTRVFRDKINKIRLDFKAGQIIAPIVGHSGNVAVYNADDLIAGPAGIYRTKEPSDGYIITTHNPRLILMYAVADCPCVIALAEIPKNHYALAILHCGWKSLSEGILDNFIEKLKLTVDKLYARKIIHTLKILITPGIGPCCFVVGDEVLDKLLARCKKTGEIGNFYIKQRSDGQIHLDLFKFCWSYFERRGVRDMMALKTCAKCSGQFYSHRRGDKERNIVAVALAPFAFSKENKR